jgi:hypothetical protein
MSFFVIFLCFFQLLIDHLFLLRIGLTKVCVLVLPEMESTLDIPPHICYAVDGKHPFHLVLEVIP